MIDLPEFDLHGIVGIRLEGGEPGDIRAVERQLGPIRKPLARDPDITIRFVDRLVPTGVERHLGLNEVAYDEESFFVLRGRYKSRVRARIPFEDVGRQCTIVCERGAAAVPLLIPIVNATVLAKGWLPLHAAAFVHQGTGVVATGWSKGGKTETLLAFMARGASYVGDEWTYLSPDGRIMFGIPEPIRVWSWHLRYVPEFRKRLSHLVRARLSVLGGVSRGLGRFTRNGHRHGSAWFRTANRLKPLFDKQRFVDVAPERFFEEARHTDEARPEKILFVATTDAPDVTIQPIPPEEIVRRMVFSLQEELAPIQGAYRRYRFAFPDRACPVLDHSFEAQERALANALGGKEAFEVLHPYPVDLRELYRAVRTVLPEE